MTILRKKPLFLIVAVLVILAASLLFSRGARAATYIVGPTAPHADLEALRLDAFVTWSDGDEIELMQDDNSLTAIFNLPASVTIRSTGGLWAVAASAGATPVDIDPLFLVDGIGLTLTLENVDITGCNNPASNGGSAIDFSGGGPHTLVINGIVNLKGGDGSIIGGHAICGYAGLPLTIGGSGTGNFTGGSGVLYDGCGLSSANALTVSGSGSFTFNGSAGLDIDDEVIISGGSVTATGIQEGAKISGNLQIGFGASLTAKGNDRGVLIKGSGNEISGEGDLAAHSTGIIAPNTMGLGTGIFCNSNALIFSLTGNANISGSKGGIGLTDTAPPLELTLNKGPASVKNWVINGMTEKAFTYFSNPPTYVPMPLAPADIIFTGALAVGTYNTDVNVFTLPLTPAPQPPPSGGSYYPSAPKAPVAPQAAFPCAGVVTGRRINVYKYETLKTVLFRMSRDDKFTILGIANNGRALYIEKDGRQGYIAIRDIKATFGASLRGTALKKAGAYNLLENGKYKRAGYYPKDQMLWISGVSGKYLINKQTNVTYYLDATQWRLSLQ